MQEPTAVITMKQPESDRDNTENYEMQQYGNFKL